MNTSHVTMAVPQGMRGGTQFPAERIGAPERGCLRRSLGGSTLAWAVIAGVLVASTVAFGQETGTSSLVFGIDDNSNIWLLDISGTTSGTQSLLFSSTLTNTLANGLAYDRGRDQFFGADANGNFWWWEPGNTSFTSLGTLAGLGLGQSVSAAYYNDAYWFLGNGTPGNQLGRISLTYTAGVPTGISGTTFTITGMPTAGSGGGDMVIDPSGTLYAYSAPLLGNFFTVDVTTASSGTVGGYDLLSATSGTGLQLAFGIDDTTLYGHDRRTGNWYTIDTTDGTLTPFVGFQTFSSGTVGFNDLAGSAVGTPFVPEPATYAMALAGLACGGFSMWRRRTRR